jgi:hypothetical protein
MPTTTRSQPLIWSTRGKLVTDCPLCGRPMMKRETWIYVANDRGLIIHPHDLSDFQSQPGDGWLDIGPECGRKLGKEWIKKGARPT